MATNNPITVQRDPRLRRHFSNGYTVAAPALAKQLHGVDLCIVPMAGQAHGCTVSISRGSPPPKKR